MTMEHSAGHSWNRIQVNVNIEHLQHTRNASMANKLFPVLEIFSIIGTSVL